MKTRFLLTLSIVALTLTAGRASAEPLPMVYEAVTLASPPGRQQSTIAVVPRSVGLEVPAGSTPQPQVVQTVFESMKTRFAAAYGTTTIALSQARSPVVTINLDASKRESWRFVIAELFYTLRSFGFTSIVAPLYSNSPLTPMSIDAVVVLSAQPWYRAIGSDFPSTALVVVDETRFMTTDGFRRALSEGSPEMVRIVADGLRSPDDAVRLATVPALGLTRAPEAHAMVPALMQDRSTQVRLALLDLAAAGKVALAEADLVHMADQDPDPELRLAAARVLSARGNHDYDHVLELTGLQSSDPDVIIASLKRLRSSTRVDIAPAVARVLTSGNAEVRRLAVEILTRLRAVSVMSRTIAAGNLPSDVMEPLSISVINLCPMDEAALMWLAGQGSVNAAGRAISAVCAAGVTDGSAGCGRPASAISVLAVGARRGEQALREKAIDCLGSQPDSAALPLLMPFVQDPGLKARAGRAASAVLSRQPQPGLVSIVSGTSQASGGDKQLRLLALDAISLIPGPSMEPATIAALKALMRDNDPDIRRAVVNALARSRDPAICSAILDGIDDQDEGIRRAAVVAAAGLPGERAEAVIRKSLEDLSTPVRVAGLEALSVRAVPETRPRIRMLSGNARPEIRRPAVLAYLKSLEPGEANLIFPFVSPLMYDSDEEVRIVAVNALQDLNDTPSADAVGALVIDQSPKVRTAVATVLGRMRTDAALQYLRKGANDADPAVRRAVVEALGRFRVDVAGPILQTMLNAETDIEIRELISAMLAN